MNILKCQIYYLHYMHVKFFNAKVYYFVKFLMYVKGVLAFTCLYLIFIAIMTIITFIIIIQIYLYLNSLHSYKFLFDLDNIYLLVYILPVSKLTTVLLKNHTEKTNFLSYININNTNVNLV